LSQITRLTDR